MLKSFFTFLFLSLVFGVFHLSAQHNQIHDPDQARSIYEEMENRRNSIATEIATIQMTITDSRGRNRNRILQTWSSNEGDHQHTLFIFSEPGNVRGTALLNLDENNHRTQRLFLPSVGRIQSIGSSERGDRFMGSDFTYEDLNGQNVDEYEFEWLVIQESHYTMRALAINSDQYSALEFVIHRERYSAEQVRYFDHSGEAIKKLEAEYFEQISEKLWSPSKMTMFDLREGRHTTLEWLDRIVNQPIEPWRFTERGLRRGI